MIEIFEKILKYLPQFFSECGAIISGPKSFVVRKVDSEILPKSDECFLFMALSVAITTLASASLPFNKGFNTLLIINFVVVFVGIVAFSFVLRAAWWTVGGRAPYEKFFAAYTYIVGPIMMLGAILNLISYGILRILDPVSFYALYHASTAQDRGIILGNSSAVVPFNSSLGIGYVLLSFWTLVSWDAYREINHLSEMRSFLAFILFGILSLPVMVLYFLLVVAFD